MKVIYLFCFSELVTSFEIQPINELIRKAGHEGGHEGPIVDTAAPRIFGSGPGIGNNYSLCESSKIKINFNQWFMTIIRKFE